MRLLKLPDQLRLQAPKLGLVRAAANVARQVADEGEIADEVEN